MRDKIESVIKLEYEIVISILFDLICHRHHSDFSGEFNSLSEISTLRASTCLARDKTPIHDAILK